MVQMGRTSLARLPVADSSRNYSPGKAWDIVFGNETYFGIAFSASYSGSGVKSGSSMRK